MVFFLGIFHGCRPDVVILRISGDCKGGRGLREKIYHQHGVWHVIKKAGHERLIQPWPFRMVMRLLRLDHWQEKKLPPHF
ncbi:MAG: hypothetical protein ABIP76_01905, partial [Verrucomicrobiota bacterium]